jgi:ribonuclease Z
MHKAVALILTAAFSSANLPAAHSADTVFRVTLLGSGTPDPSPDRFGPSTLIEAGDQKMAYPVDSGDGHNGSRCRFEGR